MWVPFGAVLGRLSQKHLRHRDSVVQPRGGFTDRVPGDLTAACAKSRACETRNLSLPRQDEKLCGLIFDYRLLWLSLVPPAASRHEIGFQEGSMLRLTFGIALGG